MANFSYIKGSLAGWANNTTLSQGDMWQFDQNQHDAINGAGGGTYAPTGTITIGGLGVTISGAPFVLSGTSTLTVAGTATFNGNVALGNAAGDALSVAASSVFAAAVDVRASATLGLSAADAVTINGTTTFGAAVTANSTVTCAGALVASATATFAGAVAINGALSANATVTLDHASVGGAFAAAGNVSFSNATATATLDCAVRLNNSVTIGSGGQIPIRTLWVSNTNASIDPSVYDEVIITVLSDNNKTMTLATATAIEGSHILFVNQDADNSVTLTDTAGALNVSLDPHAAVAYRWHTGAYAKAYYHTAT